MNTEESSNDTYKNWVPNKWECRRIVVDGNLDEEYGNDDSEDLVGEKFEEDCEE